MPLSNMKELIARADAQGRAVGAFSVSSIDMALGVAAAAEALQTPVILQVAQCRLTHTPLAVLGAAMLACAKNARVDIGVHLDHGLTLPCVKEALALGFTSVMIDGSALPLAQNIALTKRVIDMAAPYGAAVEAEIGRVGRSEAGGEGAAVCADPQEGARFALETGVDALAVGIGNAHGVYKGAPALRFSVLEDMRALGVSTPFVLHGGTGISDEAFKTCVRLGMRKINIATAIFGAVTQAAQGARDYFDMSARMQRAAQAAAERHIRVFGVSGARNTAEETA